MSLHKKFVSHLFWIIFAFLIGISASYVIIKGSAFAYETISQKVKILTTENTIIASQDISALPEETKNSEVISEKITPNLSEIENGLNLGFVGDIIPGPNAPDNIFSDITSYTQKPDLMIGNFEGVVTDNNEYLKCKNRSANCFSFRSDTNFISLLSTASFDVLNIANNHFNDYGQIGQEETLQKIQEQGIAVSGIKGKITYVNKNGLTIGIISFSTYPWTTNMNDFEMLKKFIQAADQTANIVIVIFHGGGEGINYTHTPDGEEWYLGENRGNLRLFGHSAIEAGADIVLGSGPHVLRGIEWYKNKLIAYSLGNFSSANAISTSGLLKTSAMLDLTLNKDGSFISGTVFPFEIDGNGIPHRDPNNTSISIINNLSKSDFGEQGVILDSSGLIILK